MQVRIVSQRSSKMKTLHKVDLKVSFNEQFFYKDCSFNFLLKKFDKDLVDKIKSFSHLLPNKKHITVDIGFLKMDKGDKTCVDTGWHVDGVGNEYLILCMGDFRTEFLAADAPATQFPDVRCQLRDFNKSIASKLSDAPGEEAPDATLIHYNSQDIHRGRVASHAGERFFLRICSSDYLIPKNFKLK